MVNLLSCDASKLCSWTMFPFFLYVVITTIKKKSDICSTAIYTEVTADSECFASVIVMIEQLSCLEHFQLVQNYL